MRPDSGLVVAVVEEEEEEVEEKKEEEEVVVWWWAVFIDVQEDMTYGPQNPFEAQHQICFVCQR